MKWIVVALVLCAIGGILYLRVREHTRRNEERRRKDEA